MIGHAIYNGYLLIVHPRLLTAIEGAHDPLAMKLQPLWLDGAGLVLAGLGIVWLAKVLAPGPARAFGT